MTDIETANVTPTGTWDYTNGTVSVPTPTTNAHAASKQYVDTTTHAILMGNTLGGSITSSEDDVFLVASGSKSEDTDVDDVYLVAPASGTWKNAYFRVEANTLDANMTVNSYIGGSNGNIAITITASTSGVFSDTSNSDSLSPENLIALHATHSATSGSVTHPCWGTQILP